MTDRLFRFVFQAGLPLLVCALFIAACSKSNPAGPSGLTLACPADVALEIVDTPTVELHYPAPAVAGGTAPVAVECSLPTGSPLGPGETMVHCTATDAAARVAECSFRATVHRVPRLRGGRIVAFGDSITRGEVSNPAPGMAAVRYLDPENAYPTQLERMLRERYTAQEIVVINEGIPGEQVLGSLPGSGGQTGEGRIEDVAVLHRPDVLIVLEGVNGLRTENASDISEGLRRGVRRAIRQGVPLVIVSTILPGVEGRIKPPSPEAVEKLNDRIRGWASAEGAVLVDSYAHFLPEKERLIGEDGLHPTIAGYTRLAEIFRDAIQAHFELPPPEPVPPPAPPQPPDNDPPAEEAPEPPADEGAEPARSRRAR
ncbi:MAG: SGNH/GDSL hydrolase family protein [Acidobacteriota bacterium]